MEVTDIMTARDGGTITFRIVDGGALSGAYRLQTPFLGTPRPLFHDEVRLRKRSRKEKGVAAALQGWLDTRLTPDLAAALRELDSRRIWQNLPDHLLRAVPLHRVRTVVKCLRARWRF